MSRGTLLNKQRKTNILFSFLLTYFTVDWLAMGETEFTQHTLFCVHIVSTKSKAKSCKSSPENGSSPDTTKSILSHYLTLFIILIFEQAITCMWRKEAKAYCTNVVHKGVWNHVNVFNFSQWFSSITTTTMLLCLNLEVKSSLLIPHRKMLISTLLNACPS